MDINVIATGSSGNCYQISDGETTLLIECGIPFKKIQKAMDFKLSTIDGCLVSHIHMDHAKAVKDLIKAGIEVYTGIDTIKGLEIKSHRIHGIKSKSSFKIRSLIVTPFDLPHDGVECYGFQIKSTVTGKKLIYISDAMYCKYKFKGITHLMIEANYTDEKLQLSLDEHQLNNDLRNRVRRSHMSLEQTLSFLKANDLSKTEIIFLLHLSDVNSDENTMKSLVQEATGIPVIVC